MTELGDAGRRKARESADTIARFFDLEAERIALCAREMQARFARGGHLLSFGNGGSACDAEHVAVEFLHPVIEKRTRLPARALGQSRAWLTAIGNDEDFSLTHLRELEVSARPEDIALGISTSGKSANVNRALRRAREMGLFTIGLSGRDGGSMCDNCEHAFVVPSFSIHRIQEAHVTLLHVLWDLVHMVRGEEDVL